jgi:hypothetical protein
MVVARLAMGPSQHLVLWAVGNGGLFPGNERAGHEADHMSPSGAKVKNAWNSTSILPYVFMAWCLIKHRDSFTYGCLLSVNNGV